jgi:hypothetical protein
MNARAPVEEFVPAAWLDPVTKARLVIAGYIAGGIAGNAGVWAGPDPRGTIARDAWDIAGKLILLAESGGC